MHTCVEEHDITCNYEIQPIILDAIPHFFSRYYLTTNLVKMCISISYMFHEMIIILDNTYRGAMDVHKIHAYQGLIQLCMVQHASFCLRISALYTSACTVTHSSRFGAGGKLRLYPSLPYNQKVVCFPFPCAINSSCINCHYLST